MHSDSTGYSKTPLARKLGLNQVSTVRIVNPPHDFWNKVRLDPDAFEIVEKDATMADWQQAFVSSESELESLLPELRAAMHPTSVLWISWPKGGRSERGEITREAVRSIALKTDLVDVKVCAFDETWSALKFMIRKSER